MPAPIPCEYISWNAANALARKLADTVCASGFDPEIVVGVARGGWPPARIVSDWLGRPRLLSIRLEHYQGIDHGVEAAVRHGLPENVAGKRVLIVDDVNDTGVTLSVAKAYVQNEGAPAEVRVGVLHHKITAKFKPDYAATRMRTWRWVFYPWSVIESLVSLFGKIENLPGTPEAVRRRLQEENRISVPLAEIRQALAMFREMRGLGEIHPR
ncbi:xanthine-guanine phosphoribosyltransferase [hydrocarbon metagenome]|uniref:Xanthine-guanine phosphoribosyltransferase n=1 Tax=hydrocarbon metagenome TaxID=938273 RepID=A0A0W8G224_9ZZZZ